MNKAFFIISAALPAIIAPADARQQTDAGISATDFVQTQISIIRGMTELLSIKGIENAPQEVAAGIQQLAAMVQQLAALKPAAAADEAAGIEVELADQARTAARELQQALQRTADSNFYNSQELADAVQAFANAFQFLQ